MAYQASETYLGTLNAGADLSASQFRLVKLDANGNVILGAAATDEVIGVLQNKPKTGERALVALLQSGGVLKVEAGSTTIAVGDVLKCDANGRVTDAAPVSGDIVVGIALESASAVGQVISMLAGRYKA